MNSMAYLKNMFFAILIEILFSNILIKILKYIYFFIYNQVSVKYIYIIILAITKLSFLTQLNLKLAFII